MDGDRLYSIGDLARRTGLTVRTIRFYSDRGIVAPAGRSPAGYRLYDAGRRSPAWTSCGRCASWDVDLPTIRKVVRPGAVAARGRRGARRGAGRADPHPAAAARGADRGGQARFYP